MPSSMDVQAELAKAIQLRFTAVNGVEAPPKPRQNGRSSRRPEPMPKVDKASKNEAKKAAAAAIMARMGGPPKAPSPPPKAKAKRSLKLPFLKPKVSAVSTSTGPLGKEEEATAKRYRKMMKLGLPEGAVRHKMVQDGISQHIVDAVLSGEETTSSTPVSQKPSSNGARSNRSSLSPQEEKIAAQYRRMLKIKMPEGAVLHKMIADGVSANIRDSVMAGDEPLSARGAGHSVKVGNGVASSSSRSSSLSPQEEKIATQYRRMLKIKMPEGAIRHKMVADGVSQKIQDSVMGGEIPATSSSSTPSSSTRGSTATGPVSSLSREDEKMAAPYRKMIRMKMPEGAVRHKMAVDRVPERIQNSVLRGEVPKEDSHAAPPPGCRPANPMAAAINMSGGIESLKKPSAHPMAAAITSSGGIGSLKKTPTNADAPMRPPSNPMAAAIASSGGIKSLKKTSVQEKQAAPATTPSNPIAAAIAASAGRNGLKKTAPRNNNLQPPKPKSGNSVLDELSSKGFKSGLRKTTPKPSSPKRSSPYRSPYQSPEVSNSDSMADDIYSVEAPRATNEGKSRKHLSRIKVKSVRSASPERSKKNSEGGQNAVASRAKPPPRASPDSGISKADRPRRSTRVSPERTYKEAEEEDRPRRFSNMKIKAVRPVGTSLVEESSESSNNGDRPSRFSNIKIKAVRPVGSSLVEESSESSNNEDRPKRFSGIKIKAVRPVGTSRFEEPFEKSESVSTKKLNPPRRFTGATVKAVTPAGATTVAKELPVKSNNVAIEDNSRKPMSTIQIRSTKTPEEQRKSSSTISTKSKNAPQKYESKNLQEKLESITIPNKYESKSAKEKYPSRSVTCRSSASRSTTSTVSTSSGIRDAVALEKNFASAVQESMRTRATVVDDSGRSASRSKGRNHGTYPAKEKRRETGRANKSAVTTSDGVDHHCQCIIM